MKLVNGMTKLLADSLMALIPMNNNALYTGCIIHRAIEETIQDTHPLAYQKNAPEIFSNASLVQVEHRTVQKVDG